MPTSFRGMYRSPQSRSTIGTSRREARSLIDPSIMQTMSLPRYDAITQMLSHHWFNPLDNIDGFSREVSDVLCRAVTGDAQMKRAHYTNDDDFIYQYRRCIGINGINIAATRPDPVGSKHPDRAGPYFGDRTPH